MPKRDVTPLKIAIVLTGRTQKDVAAAVADRLGWAQGSAESKLSRIVNGLHADDATRSAIAQELGRKLEELWPEQQEMQAAA